MKRNINILTVSFIAVFCLALAGIVSAYQQGYEVNDYIAITSPVLDGSWTTDDEWNDADEKVLNGSLNAIFRMKYESSYPDWVNQYYLIEFFSDNTNDTEDYWQICYATATEFGGDPAGGTTPQPDCYRIDFIGHSVNGLAVYKGNGTGWEPFTDYTWPDHIEIVDSISSSPLNSTPHWIVEIKIEHIHFGIQPNMWIYIAAYDANNSEAGVQSWPPGSCDVPDDWGLIVVQQTQIPENLNVAVAILTLTVPMLAAIHSKRKRKLLDKSRL